jgi:hypothetical protein
MNKPIILCGAYGAPSAIDLPIDEMVDRISQSKFTGYSVFATAPAVMKGAGKNMHQFTFNKATGQFNMKNAAIRKNNRFYDRIQEMAEKFAENKIDLLFKFFTQYYQDKYVGNHKWKKNPFRNNDAGIRWGKPDSFVGRKELYDSWIKNTHSSDGSEYHWLKWKPINESQLKWNFSPVGIIGEALCEYIEETVKILVAAYKGSGARLLWASHNEQHAVWDNAAQKTVGGLSCGDRSEIYAYISERFKANGLVPNGKAFFAVVNRDTTDGANSNKGRKVLHASITRKYGMTHGLGAIHEIHHGLENRDPYIKDCKFNTNKTLWSLDASEVNAAKWRKWFLDTQGDPFRDIMFEEGISGAPPNPISEYEKNFRDRFKQHADIVK